MKHLEEPRANPSLGLGSVIVQAADVRVRPVFLRVIGFVDDGQLRNASDAFGDERYHAVLSRVRSSVATLSRG